MGEKNVKPKPVPVRLVKPAEDAATLATWRGNLGRIDQYELLRELGGGGFGVVFLARDTVANVDVAVKGLPPEVQNNSEELELIRKNFALVSKLYHPHIAAALVLHPARQVQYASEKVRRALRVNEGDYLLVMAYAPGLTVSKWSARAADGKVPVQEAVAVCRQIADALDYAHSERVVHRDIKPANVIVEPRAEGLWVRVLDFGLAAEIRSSMSRVSRDTRSVSGTPPYMAPEQWAGRKQDGASDQYSLAVMFYELVSGNVPFSGAFVSGDPMVMLNAAQNLAPESLDCLTQTQNAALLRALAKDSSQRFAHCRDFMDAMDETQTAGDAPLASCAKTIRGDPATAVDGAACGAGGAKRMWVGLAAALVLAFLAVAGYRAFMKDEAVRRSETGAREQAARVAELTSAAESALSEGDLKGAGEKIESLRLAEGGGAAAASLQRKVDDRVSQREVNKRYAEAAVARENVLKTSPGQGVGDQLRAMEAAWREADAARQGNDWTQALAGYDTVITLCKRMGETDAARQNVIALRAAAAKARGEALAAKADTDAGALFDKGTRRVAQAETAWEKDDVSAASAAWREAADAFDAARKTALEKRRNASEGLSLASVAAGVKPPRDEGGQAVPKAVAPGPELAIRLDVAGGNRVFKKGESIHFSVSVDEGCHLGLFCHQQDGSVVVLFPNAYHPDSWVKAGEQATIPGGADATFAIIIGPPYGTDVVEAIACTSKSELHALVEKKVQQNQTSYGMLDGRVFADMRAKLKDIGLSEVGADPVRWGRSALEVRTQE